MIIYFSPFHEAAVSHPRLQFLSPVSGTCWGQSLAVRCVSDQGTNVRYNWYKTGGSGDTLLGAMTDLQLHCGIVGDGEQYYCSASNSVSRKHSHFVATQVLQPGEEDCVYILTVQGKSCMSASRLNCATTEGHVTRDLYTSFRAVCFHCFEAWYAQGPTLAPQIFALALERRGHFK